MDKIEEEKRQKDTEQEPIEQKTPPPQQQHSRPPNNRSNTFSSTISSDDDDVRNERILIDDGIPPEVPLEALAGPALILPSNDLDGHTLNGEFDWEGKEDDDDNNEEEDEEKKKKAGSLVNSSIFLCMNKNSSSIAWTCIILFALIFIAIDVAIFVVYKRRVSMTSYGLELWFTWIAFMWSIAFMSQICVELIPWAIKKLVAFVRPQSIEVLRMRLSYYKALRPYIKLLLISAWAWGSWAFIKDHVPLPVIGQDQFGLNIYEGKPTYVGVFYSIWECIFFAVLFLFIEKFVLQLIVTSFHKKAYGDRIKENDKALRILDKLKKKTKKRNPQDFLLKKIRRKNKPGCNNIKSGTNTGTTTPSRSHSLDDISDSNNTQDGYRPQHPASTQNKSIMSSQQYTSNVKFPSNNMDTLIAIPALEDRVPHHTEQQHTATPDVINISPAENKGLMKRLKAKVLKTPVPSDMTSGCSDNDDYDNNEKMYNHAPLSRDSTWVSQDDTKSFFGTTRDKFFKKGKRFSSSPSPPQQQQQGYHQQNSAITQAKYLAKTIFNNLVQGDHRHTVVELDFYPFFKTTKEATYAFGLFDTDGNGDLTKRELRQGCIRIYRERKNLTRSMRDLSQATGKLDIILIIVFAVVWAIIVCAAFGVDVGTDLMPLWSAFVAASFIFGSSASDAFEAIIFVFVTHPFDSGDRVLIGPENWVVDNVGLLVTTFIKWDGTLVYVKNSVLTTQYIINVRRSGRTGETIDIQISFNTPSWKIKKLTGHMTEWANQHPKLYTPNAASTNITAIQNLNLINLSFYFEHTQNWQDPGGRWLRHNNFMMELKEACERLDVSYALPTQPVSYINGANDGSPEAYNMGSKSGYGLEGMVRRRRHPFEASRHEETFYDETHRSLGGEGNHSGSNSSSSGGHSGTEPAAAAAAAMMFAESMQ